jgi:hypothetical protein
MLSLSFNSSKPSLIRRSLARLSWKSRILSSETSRCELCATSSLCVLARCELTAPTRSDPFCELSSAAFAISANLSICQCPCCVLVANPGSFNHPRILVCDTPRLRAASEMLTRDHSGTLIISLSNYKKGSKMKKSFFLYGLFFYFSSAMAQEAKEDTGEISKQNAA